MDSHAVAKYGETRLLGNLMKYHLLLLS